MSNSPKLSRWQASKSLAKSAWQVLRRDRTLGWLPILSGISVLLILAIAVTLVITTSTFHNGVAGSGEFFMTGPLVDPGVTAVGFYVAVVLLITFVSTLFDGALIAGALQRFGGKTPTVASSLAAARRRLGSLFGFGIFSTIIGTLLRSTEEHVPVFAQISSAIAGAAWAVASMFAIPVIVSSPKKVGPIAATKQSVAVIKKTWGENIILSGGIGIIALLSIVGFFAAVSLIVAVGSAILQGTGASADMMAASFEFFAVVTGIAFVGLIVVLTMISAIIKSAVYHYATTGKAPNAFERDVVQACFTTKKARNVFTA